MRNDEYRQPTTTLPPGWTTTMLLRCLGIAKGDAMHAAAVAEGFGHDQVARVCKALVDPMNSADLPAAMKPFEEDLAALIRPQTIIGRLPLLRRVPFRTRLLRQLVGGTATFVAEGEPIPLSAEGFDDTVELGHLRIAGIRLVTNESLRNVSRGASAMLAQDIGSAIVDALDRRFLDPASGAVDLVSPASITNGGTRLSSTGSGIADIDSDLKAMIATLVAADMPLSSAVWVMSPITATYLALLRGTAGAPAYPLMSATGGVLCGLPVLTSSAVSASGSPGERYICLLEQSEIMIADDNEARFEVSGNATAQMLDNPASGAAQAVSFWQLGLSGIKCTRFINWMPRRDGAVAVLENVVF